LYIIFKKKKYERIRLNIKLILNAKNQKRRKIIEITQNKEFKDFNLNDKNFVLIS
jgi:hypothetical protein